MTLVVVDLSTTITNDDVALIERAREQGRRIVIGNRCDLPLVAELAAEHVSVSALTGEGIEELRSKIRPAAGEEHESGFITNIRHEQRLRGALRR